MQFNPDFKPNRDNLAPRMVEMMNRVFYSRRAQGMNVQFINEYSKGLDEWSFESAERAEKFAASLERKGVPHAISH